MGFVFATPSHYVPHCTRGLDPSARAAFAEMLREQLVREGVIELEAVGSSMMPTVPGGSLLQIEPLVAPLALDELVALVPERGALLWCHRVVAIDADGYVETQGDRHALPDRPVHPNQIVGVVRRFKLGGKVYHSLPERPRPRPSKYRAQRQRVTRWRRRLGSWLGAVAHHGP